MYRLPDNHSNAILLGMVLLTSSSSQLNIIASFLLTSLLLFPIDVISEARVSQPISTAELFTTTQAMQTVLAGEIGTKSSINISIQGLFSLPTHEEFPPVALKRNAKIDYHLQADTLIIAGSDLPALHGSLLIKDNRLNLTANQLSNRDISITWKAGREIELHGLTLAFQVVRAGRNNSPYPLHLTTPPIHLTTGTVTVAGKVVRGEIDLLGRRIVMVGHFPMPSIGIPEVDQKIAAEPVFIAFTLSAAGKQ